MTANVLIDIQRATQASTPSDEQITCWTDLALSEYLQNHHEGQELTIRFVDEAEIQLLNATYRQKDKTTNVLSFPYEQAPGLHVPLLGDLVLCAPVILDEAQNQGKTSDAHWAHILIHGILHLLGYDHIKTGDAEKMEQFEVNLLAKLGYANPYL